MSLKTLRVLLAASIVVLSASPRVLAATELKVSGSATLAGTLITPNKPAIEKEAGLTLMVAVNGDGSGMKDLDAGRTDAAKPPIATARTRPRSSGTASTSLHRLSRSLLWR